MSNTDSRDEAAGSQSMGEKHASTQVPMEGHGKVDSGSADHENVATQTRAMLETIEHRRVAVLPASEHILTFVQGPQYSPDLFDLPSSLLKLHDLLPSFITVEDAMKRIVAGRGP